MNYKFPPSNNFFFTIISQCKNAKIYGWKCRRSPSLELAGTSQTQSLFIKSSLNSQLSESQRVTFLRFLSEGLLLNNGRMCAYFFVYGRWLVPTSTYKLKMANFFSLNRCCASNVRFETVSYWRDTIHKVRRKGEKYNSSEIVGAELIWGAYDINWYAGMKRTIEHLDLTFSVRVAKKRFNLMPDRERLINVNWGHSLAF